MKRFYTSYILILLIVFLHGRCAEGAMSTYCSTPPFVTANVTPNIMILLDNSLSMLMYPAYPDGGGSNKCTSSGSPCTEFDTNTQYYGLFDSTYWYTYTGGGTYTSGCCANDKFSPSVLKSSRAKLSTEWDGNFLNWLTMKRVDVAKLVLTGGKIMTTAINASYVAEPSGYDRIFAEDGSGDIYKKICRPSLYTSLTDNGQNCVSLSVPSLTTATQGATGGSLSASTTYYYKITACDASSNCTTASNERSASTSSTKKQISLVWGSVSGAASYRIWRGTSAGGENKYCDVSSSSTTYNDNGTCFSSSGTPPNPTITTFRVDGTGGGYTAIPYFYDNASTAFRWRIQAKVVAPVQGVIQEVGNKARWGLTYYDTSGGNDGGKVQVNIGNNNYATVVSTINQMTPSTYTPLGEALWSVVGYFAQKASSVGAGGYGSGNGGTGPQYHSGDYTISAAADPYKNYITLSGGSTNAPCAQSYVILITDGNPTQDANLPSGLTDFVRGNTSYNCEPYATSSSSSSTCGTSTTPCSCLAAGPFSASQIDVDFSGAKGGLEDVAYFMHTQDLRSDLSGTQTLTLYSIFAFGTDASLLKYAAINGSFAYDSATHTSPSTTTPYSDWTTDSVAYVPDNYFIASDGYALQTSLRTTFQRITKGAAAGTSASVLADKVKSGDNVLQAAFYPSKDFSSSVTLKWIGYLNNLWFYNTATVQNMREDTNPDDVLNLVSDRIIAFDFVGSQLVVHQWSDSDADGKPNAQLIDKSIDSVVPVWESGTLLFQRSPLDTDTNKRILYVNAKVDAGDTYPKSAANGKLVQFISANKAYFNTYLSTLSTPTLNSAANASGGALTASTTYYYKVSASDGSNITPLSNERNAATTSANKKITISWSAVTGATDYIVWRGTSSGGENVYYDTGSTLTSFTDDGSYTYISGTPPTAIDDSIISYTRGSDTTGSRSRTVTLSGTTNTWKLGDIVYSTPLVESYANYSIAFVGANDGMLHAFEMGKLSRSGLSTNDVDKLVDENGNTNTNLLGKELWAFIPRHSLPYLRYLSDPNYCHIYYVDLHPYMFYNGSQKILIGGMRLGSACSASCGSTCISTDPVISPPTDTCPDSTATNGTCTGMSSYFAFDVTDPVNPILLWEFSDPDLGFSFSGPAVVTRGGNKFVLFLNGPQTYMGNSYKPLTVHWLKLDPTTMTIISKGKQNPPLGSSGAVVNNAFGGRLFTDGVDINSDGDTDYVMFGYVQPQGTCDGTSTGTACSTDADCSGGLICKPSIYRMQGNIASLYISGTDPTVACSGTNCQTWNNCWKYQNVFSTAKGPFTAKVTTAECFSPSGGKSYNLFAGSGKYFIPSDDYPKSTLNVDSIYGIHFCDSTETYLGCCLRSGGLNYTSGGTNRCSDYTTGKSSATTNFAWKFDLDTAETDATTSIPYARERLISDPVVTSAYIAYLSTTQPSSDICAFGGRSRVWALNCATGDAVFATDCASTTCPAGYACVTSTSKTCGGGFTANACSKDSECTTGIACTPVKTCQCSSASISNFQGTLLLQLSTAAISTLHVAPGSGSGTRVGSGNDFNQFTSGTLSNRTTNWLSGITPESAPPFVDPPSSTKTGTIIHWLER
ncbi:MAG: hypothetical protein HQL06_01685 [Nitrospirae bacterium]|nr:hypothetical protein [Nitrospirota bacterium]